MNGNNQSIPATHHHAATVCSRAAGQASFVHTFLRLVIAPFLLLSAASVHAEDNDAMAILKSMSDYVGSQQAIELTFESNIEVITPELEKIQLTN